MNKPLFSIIIPCYNSQATIERAVDSVLREEASSVEIIIVDDCSSDNTFDLCERMAKKHNCIKVLKHKMNMGQTISRNDGIPLVCGEWLLFLDSDDVLKKGILAKYKKIIYEHGPDIIFAGYETCGNRGIIKQFIPSIQEGLINANDFGKYLFSEVKPGLFTCVGSKLYKTDFIKRRKDYTGNEIKTNWDMAFALDAFISCKTIYCLREIGYSYLLREGSISYSYRENMYQNISYARRRIKDYLKACGCYEKKELEYALFHYSLIRASLGQEIKYKKGYQHFKHVLNDISNDSTALEVASIISSSDLSRKYKVFMKYVQKNKALPLYVIHLLFGGAR